MTEPQERMHSNEMMTVFGIFNDRATRLIWMKRDGASEMERVWSEEKWTVSSFHLAEILSHWLYYNHHFTHHTPEWSYNDKRRINGIQNWLRRLFLLVRREPLIISSMYEEMALDFKLLKLLLRRRSGVRLKIPCESNQNIFSFFIPQCVGYCCSTKRQIAILMNSNKCELFQILQQSEMMTEKMSVEFY